MSMKRMIIEAALFVSAACRAFTVGDLTYSEPDSDNQVSIVGCSSSATSVDIKSTVKYEYIDYEYDDDTGEYVSRVRHKTCHVTRINDYAFYEHSGITGDLEIPSGVKSIGNYAFFGCSGLNGKLTLPDGLTSIGDHAFRGCNEIHGGLTIPSSVKTIGSYAFWWCRNLTGDLIIPSSVESIGKYAFIGCTGFTGKLKISEGIENIEECTFDACSGFTGDLIIPSSVKSIGRSAFYNCKGFTGDLTIPAGVTSISDSAFYGCSGFNGRLTFSGNVASIGASAFYNCKGFTGDLTIPAGVTSISDSTFYGCSGFNGRLTISGDVTSIGYAAFSDCENFNDIVIGIGVESIGTRAFYKCKAIRTLAIPDSVVSLGSDSFKYCDNLEAVTIGCGLTTGAEDAFVGCGELKEYVVSSGNASYSSYGGVLYDKSQTSVLDCPAAIETLQLPQGLPQIGDYAFSYLPNLKTVRVPSSVKRIGQGAFSECYALKNVYLAEGVEKIGESAFEGCECLSGISFSSSLKSIGYFSFAYCALKEIDLQSNTITIDDMAFYGCQSLEKVRLPSNLARIGVGVFESCTKLNDVNIPESLEEIGKYAFAGCESLTDELILPEGLLSIGPVAFGGCSGLPRVSIPTSLTSLGDCAFIGCGELMRIIFLGEPPEVFCEYDFQEPDSAVVGDCKAEYKSEYQSEWESVVDEGYWHGLQMEPSSYDIVVRFNGNGGVCQQGGNTMEVVEKGGTVGEDIDFPVFSRGNNKLLGWIVGGVPYDGWNDVNPKFDWTDGNFSALKDLYPVNKPFNFRDENLQFLRESGIGEDRNGVLILDVYAVWTESVTVNLFNNQSDMSDPSTRRLEPSDLEKHIAYRFSYDNYNTRHRSGDTVELPPGSHYIVFYVDSAYTDYASLFTAVGSDGNPLPGNSGTSVYSFQLQSKWLDFLGLYNLGKTSATEIDIQVSANVDSKGSVQFNCTSLETAEQRQACNDFPKFDIEKVVIWVWAKVSEWPFTGGKLKIMPNEKCLLPVGDYWCEFSYGEELYASMPFWWWNGMLGDQIFCISVKKGETTSRDFVFRPFGTESANYYKIKLDPGEGTVSPTYLWRLPRRGNDSLSSYFYPRWLPVPKYPELFPELSQLSGKMRFKGWHTVKKKCVESLDALYVMNEWDQENIRTLEAWWQNDAPDMTIEEGELKTLQSVGASSVRLSASVTSIATQAFAGCEGLAAIVFEGNAPEVEDGAFYGLEDCTILVSRDSTGWNVDMPGTWNGMNIDFADEYFKFRSFAAFASPEIQVDEGETVTVTVNGGNIDEVSNVQMYLTYNTAAAADLDLAKGTIAGVMPKGGLKFPLTLSWAKGEIGEKVITIPVKADKTVEDDEFFTLQLADAQGMELGEDRVCTVTILDANDKTLKTTVTAHKPKKGEVVSTNSVTVVAGNEKGGFVSGTGEYTAGSKLTLTAESRPGWSFVGWRLSSTGEDGDILSTKAKWQIVVTNDEEYVAVFEKIPYVRGLADPADGGKVSGSGLCAAGKKVTLKAAANKNFMFLGWRQGTGNGELGTGNGELGTGNGFVATTASLVIDRTAKPAADSKTSTTLTNVAEDVTYYAVFKSDPEVFVIVDSTDGTGAEPTGNGAGKYVAGTITGMGKYAPGKKVTLKATANKGYVFAGWVRGGRGATALPDDVISQAASLSFTMPSNDVEYVAMFVTAEEDKGSIALVVNGTEMRLAGDGSPHQTNVWAGVYLEWPVAASALSETKVKVAGLPSGLKFTDKPVTSKIGSGKTAVVVTNVPANTIYGAPTAASKTDKDGNVTPSTVKVTVTTAGKSSATYEIALTVDPLPAWAVGTFDGYVRGSGTLAASGEDGSGEGSGESAASPKGLAAVTVSAAGKISGKILEGGKTWALSAAWFDEARLAEDGSPHQDPSFTATVIGKAGKEEITNEVVVAAGVVRLGEDASPHLVGVVSGETVGRAVPGEPLSWTACQNLWKRADTKAAQPVFKKSIDKVLELGAAGDANNTLKLTFKKDGAVAFAGKVGGVSVSGSSQLVRLAGDGSPYQVTLYAPPKPTAKPPFEGFCKTLAVRLTLDEQRVVTKAVIVDEILDDWLNSNPDEEDEEDFYGPS